MHEYLHSNSTSHHLAIFTHAQGGGTLFILMAKFVKIEDAEFEMGAISFNPDATDSLDKLQLQRFDSELTQRWKVTETTG